MLYEERHLRADGRMLEIGLGSAARFQLRYGRPGNWLVSYEPGRRTVNGRRQRYEFKSVEQLRYDFEQDVKDAERQA